MFGLNARKSRKSRESRKSQEHRTLDIASQDSVASLIRHRAETRPEQVAFFALNSQLDVSSELTYQRLYQRACDIAANLQKQALVGERALLLIENGQDYLEVFLGCLFAGVIAVTCYPPRSGRARQRLTQLCLDCQPKALISDQADMDSAELLAELNGPSICLYSQDLMGSEHWEKEIDIEAIHPDQLAYLQYSSGSTGSPKGVKISHRNLLANWQAIADATPVHADMRGLSWLPLYHDMGLVGGLMAPIALGFPIYLMSAEYFLMRPRRWLEALSRYNINWTVAPSFAYQHCVDRVDPSQLDLNLEHLDVAWIGAEPVQVDLLKQFYQRFSALGFRQSAFYPCYGMAETTLFLTGGEHDAPPSAATRLSDHGEPTKIDNVLQAGRSDTVSCGHAWQNHELRVIDPDSGAILPDGQIGELCCHGPSVTSGYWNGSDTDSCFVRLQGISSASQSEGSKSYLRTGDLGFLWHGELYITGRLKNMFIVAGRNIYGEDIERVAASSHELIMMGAVAAFEGEQGLAIAAELDRKAFADKESANLLADIEQSVKEAIAAELEIAINAVFLVRRSTLPRTTSGKLERHQCPQLFARHP